MKNAHIAIVCLAVYCVLNPATADTPPPETPSIATLFGESTIIDKQNEATLAATIAHYNKKGGTIILSPEVEPGAMPVRPNHNTRIIDLRYGEGISLVRGNHPRLEGIWPQYSGWDTGLRKNLVIADVVPYDASVESWKGETKTINPANTNRRQTSDEFANTHNHYQNVLSEVWAFSPTVNAVALWGDSGAFYPGVRSWGGFLSARSWPVHWQDYVPAGTPEFEDKDFDASLVGLEVDVLNGGLAHGAISQLIGIPLSKIGVQIVGFGNKNTAAVELRSEDSDDQDKGADTRRGTWHYGIIEHNALNEDSTLLITTTPSGKTGADFSRTRYSDSAIKINSQGKQTGISFNDYQGGELYTEENRLVARMGEKGLSVLSPSGREIIRINAFGEVQLNGGGIAYSPGLMLPIMMFAALLVMGALLYRLSKQLRATQAELAEMHALRP
jgi:hypothetical protein